MKRQGIFRYSIYITIFVMLSAPLLYSQTVGDGRISLAGEFRVLWGDPPPGQNRVPKHRFFLSDDSGVSWELVLDAEKLRAAGGFLLFNRRRIVVKGRLEGKGAKRVVVDDIAIEQPLEKNYDKQYKVSGSQPYVWILLRFADIDTTPEQPAWFQSQALGGYPSMDDFWREVSFNNINLTGSAVYGWYDLPNPRASYVYDMDNDGDDEFDIDRATNHGVSVADADVYFPDFIGINFIFNENLDGPSWGGPSDVLYLDFHVKTYGCTWMPPWGWQNQGTLGHEMGHSLGLGHCSGPYGQTYDSQWGVMSGSDGTCAVSDPTYSCLGVHTISYHKDILGWIPSGNRWVAPITPEVTTLTLYNLALAAPAGRYHTVRLPKLISGYIDFYTIELRRFTGYDRNIPDPAVLMHDVMGNYAYVVDADGNGDCNDAGAIWEAGESFADSTNKIVVTVESSGTNSAVVTFSNAARSTVFVDGGNNGTENGTSAFPWNTVWEGQGSVLPNGNVYISPGSYNETMAIRKAMVLRAWNSGTVAIGK